MMMDELKNALERYSIEEKYCDEKMGLRCCELAFEALETGCYGVGAILYGPDGKLRIDARNEVFLDGFHSDRHAEMVVLNRFEAHYPDYDDRGNLTVMVSLEPCPMCFTRLLLAGIGQIKFLATDTDGGMVNRLSQMPPAWQNLAQIQRQHPANVSPTLSALASELASCRLEQLRKRLLKTIRR